METLEAENKRLKQQLAVLQIELDAARSMSKAHVDRIHMAEAAIEDRDRSLAKARMKATEERRTAWDRYAAGAIATGALNASLAADRLLEERDDRFGNGL